MNVNKSLTTLCLQPLDPGSSNAKLSFSRNNNGPSSIQSQTKSLKNILSDQHVSFTNVLNVLHTFSSYDANTRFYWD